MAAPAPCPTERAKGVSRGRPTERAVPVTRVTKRAAGSSTAAAEAYEALVTLGFRAHEAKAAVAQAVAHVGGGPLEVLVAAALRACPRPRASG